MKLKNLLTSVGSGVSKGVGGLWAVLKKYALYTLLGVVASSMSMNYILWYRLEQSQSSLESIKHQNLTLTTTIETMKATEQYRQLLGDSLTTSVMDSVQEEANIHSDIDRIIQKHSCDCTGRSRKLSEALQGSLSPTQYIVIGEGVKQPSAPTQTSTEASTPSIQDIEYEYTNENPTRSLTPDSIRVLKSRIQGHREATK